MERFDFSAAATFARARLPARMARPSWPFLLALLAACNPVFNWRETRIGDDGVVVLLPCKPDRATRSMPLGGVPAEIEMAGCQAGGATFAIARVQVVDLSEARERLAAWRAATREQWSGATLEEQPAALPKAAPTPAPLALRATGAKTDGEASQARMLWFVQSTVGAKPAVYQAMVLGTPSQDDASSTFFEGIHLP